VPDIVEDCGKSEVEGVLIISSGFREMGEEGKALENRIIALQKRSGMRIVGPESLGIIRPNIDLNATFLAVHPEKGTLPSFPGGRWAQPFSTGRSTATSDSEPFPRSAP